MINHIPVLLKESIEYLDPKPGDVIVDGTLGGGGHAREICNRIGERGTLIGIEQDRNILEETKKRFKIYDSRCKNIILINGNFRDLDGLVPSNITEIDGIILDLGWNSAQLEESGRGFSFQKNEPLLMTYKTDIGIDDLTAMEIVNMWGEKDIADILYEYGEERYSRRIAKGITDFRKSKKIETTFDLVEIIRTSVPATYRNNRKLNCSTKTFQALRIVVNDELEALEEGISKAWDLLAEEGRMVVISFHSLEDRIVKNFFRDKKKEGAGEILTKKPIVPSHEEVKMNPRSRSAKMRAIRKIAC